MNNEPVAWMIIDVDNGKSLQFKENKFSEINIPLYTAPRELSDEEISLVIWESYQSIGNATLTDLCKAILKKASEK